MLSVLLRSSRCVSRLQTISCVKLGSIPIGNYRSLYISNQQLVRFGGQPPPNPDKPEKDEQSSEQANENEGEKKQEEPTKPKIDPATLRKLRMYVLAVAGLSFVSSFLILSQFVKEGSGGLPHGVTSELLTQQPSVDFQMFADKYLKSGETKNIVFCPQQQRALAFLHDGAVVDGQRVRETVLVVHYPGNAQQFWADVRKEEALIGVALTNGIKIDLYQGLSTFRVIEFAIGILIIVFLGSQYGRLLRKRFLEKKGKSPS